MKDLIENEPGIVWCKPWGEGQGDYVRVSVADFDPDQHEPYDPDPVKKKPGRPRKAAEE